MSKGTPLVAVRLAPELRDRLAMLAYARGVALSDVIREALTEYVDRAESQSALSESASLVREIRYTSAVEDGVRYVEVVDGNGEHVASGMGEAADALEDLVLYLLPPDHPDYPDA